MSRAGGDQQQAISRLLGAEAAGGGPLALLGVQGSTVGDDAVRSALESRLAEVDRHPLAHSMDAEQVRMALHAAAAQLLDPALRALILGLNRPRSERAIPAAAPVDEPPNAVPEEAIADARLVIARHRGINDSSLRRIAAIAGDAGVGVQDLLAAVAARLATSAPAPPIARDVDSVPPSLSGEPDLGAAPFPEEIDHATHTLRNAAVIAVVAIGLLAVAVGVVWEITSAMRVPTRVADAPAPAPIAPPAAPKRDGPLFPVEKGAAPPKPAPADPVSLVRVLTASAEEVSAVPDTAIANFEGAMRALADLWPTLTPDRLAAAQDGVVEFLYRAARDPATTRRAADAIAAPAGEWVRGKPPLAEAQVLPGIWSFGLLSRLARERELPAAAQQAFEALATAAGVGAAKSVGSFQVGATAAAFRLPTLLVIPAEGATAARVSPSGAWKRWISAVEAISRDDGVLRERLLLAGLETLLTQGPDPERANEAGEIAALLTSSISWRAGDDSRARLLAWFDNQSISATDLNAITEHLALRSAAEGVDVSMVVPRGADQAARDEMKSRFAAVWTSVDAPTRDALAAEWQKVAKERIEASRAPGTPTGSLTGAVIFSRLNDAAARIASGDAPGAGDLLRRLDDPIRAIALTAPAPVDRDMDEGGDDGSWAVRYLAAEKNIPQRSALLTELESSNGALSRVSAEVLAMDAVRGAPAAIRRRAQRIVLKFSGQPAMVNAILELAPSVPPTNESADLIRSVAAASLPALRDALWRAAVRRVLVERLLQLIAARSDHGVVDKLAEQLSLSYVARTSTGSQSASSASAEAPARSYALWWLRRCQSLTPGGREPLTLDQIERRRAGRERLAAGLVQAFAADQVWVFELFAFATATERPADAPAVAAIIDAVAASRRGAAHVFDQVLAAERGQTELWMLRLKELGAP